MVTGSKRAWADDLPRLKTKHPKDAPLHRMCVLLDLDPASAFRGVRARTSLAEVVLFNGC